MGTENKGIAAEISQELDKIQSGLNEKTTKLQEAIERSENEIKEHGKISDEVKGLIADLSKKHESLETEFKDEIKTRLDELEQRSVRSNGSNPERKSLGQYFIESEGTKEFAGKQKHKGQSPALQLKDITSTAASAGDGIWAYQDQELVSNPFRPRMMRSLIPTIPVNSNLVQWVQTNVRTNNAAAVSETGAIPKSELTYDRKESAVRKIAHYFKTSAEVLQDFDRLRAEIDIEGFEMLRQEEEDQLLSGDGTGVNLLGMTAQATAYSTGLTQSGDTAVDVLRRAILQVRQSYYGATGIVLNPADWAAIELLKDSQNAYLFSSARDGADARLWGLPVVESDAITSGKFMVGAFATAATIYDAMDAAVYLSTENDTDFVNDLVSIKFEERLALAVKRPLSFVYGNLTGA